MKYILHQDDLPKEVYIGSSIAIDTETTGLNLVRDRLCLIQICTEHNEIHLIKINKNSINFRIFDKLDQPDKIYTGNFNFKPFYGNLEGNLNEINLN